MIAHDTKRALQDGGTVAGSFLVDLAVPGIARVLKAAGDQFIMFDQEHTGWSVATLRPLISECHRAGLAPWVRVPALTRPLVCSVLDAGALGVMVPMVETSEQARALVDFAKFPPVGRRGVGPMYADEFAGALPETLAHHNAQTLLIAMVETCAGVENVESIIAVDGIDMLWIGHGDLTASLGCPGDVSDPRFLQARDRILAAGAAAGKPVAIMGVSADDAVALAQQGFRCIGLADRALYAAAVTGAHTALSRL